MNRNTVRSQSHISITRQTQEGVVRADVHITEVGEPIHEDCFDPETCCDERERAMIAMLRAYLRPAQAPECLLQRLRDTLDHCCCEQQDNATSADR